MEADSPVILIPAYKPTSAFQDLVRELVSAKATCAIVVVNDGSGPDYEAIFTVVSELETVRLLGHIVNLGKGAALKTGMNYAAYNFPNSVGVVTADADGQHRPEDILRTAEALEAAPSHLVLGSRQFGGDIPLRSKFGNVLTRYVMRLVTGQKVSDTQTGLRGIPLDFIPDLMRLRPNGYDFELDVLLECKRSRRTIEEIPIATIYEDGNKSSHFNPLMDSMRIYFVFLRFAAISLCTAGLDNMVFVLVYHFSPYLLLCQVCSRLAAGLFNYYMNKKNVFHSSGSARWALPRYWLSVVVVGAISYLLIYVISSIGVAVIPAKIMAEALLFGFSFLIQRDFVFAGPPESGSTKESQ